MEIAVLSDIHGNEAAFRRCLKYTLSRGIKKFFFLGDYVGEQAYPQRTMELLYEVKEKYDCYFVKGNKEDYWLDYEKSGKNIWQEYDSTTGALYYAYQHLTERDMAFFKGLECAQYIGMKGLPTLCICHGSPRRTNEKMLPGEARTLSIMEETGAPVILCGHTHFQGKIEHQGKCVLNSGAVGLPLGSGGKAQFLILRGENHVWKEEFVSLDYDIDRAIRQMEEAG